MKCLNDASFRSLSEVPEADTAGTDPLRKYVSERSREIQLELEKAQQVWLGHMHEEAML